MYKPNYDQLKINVAKIIVLLLCISWFAGVQVFAQTNVSGLISSNTVWSLANSPYIVTGNVLVNNGVTLTIEPGVTVKFDNLKALQINGQLIARGTNSNYITFTSSQSAPAAGDWGFIFFSDSSADAVFDAEGNYTGGSILEYCIVEYVGGETGSYGAVEMTNAHPFVNYCIIRNNNKSGIYASNLTASLKITNSTIHHNTCDGFGGAGIYTSGGTVTISNNTISDNAATYSGGGGILINDGTPIITNNTISNNTTVRDGGAVYVQSGTAAIITNNIISGNTASMESGGIYTLYGTAAISNNIISQNNGGGIMIHYGYAGATTITNNIISGNTSPYAGGGVYIREAGATISNNVISDNAVSYDQYYDTRGGGICLGDYSYCMKVTITKNSIIRNSAKNASAVDYTGLNDENFAYNTITGNTATNSDPTYTIRISYLPLFNFNNIFNNTATYELYNINGKAPQNLNATDNWWGTTADDQIQGKIHDWFDDASLGIVNYSPYLSTHDITAPVSPPANVTKTDMGGGQIKITWSPNPEGDVAGYHVYYGGFNGYSFTNLIDAGNTTSYILSGVSIPDTIGVTAYDSTYNLANENDSTIVNDNMTNGNESWYAYAVDTTTTGISVHDNEIPKIYTIQQNYPNPFNPTTTISFALPEKSFVSLKVFDVLGREVATLVSEEFSAGNYSRQWNAENVASGIYFFRFQAGSFSETKKLLLLK